MTHDTPHPNPCPPYPGLDPDLLRLANVSGRYCDWVVLVEALTQQALTQPEDVATMQDARIETTHNGGVYPVTVLTSVIRRLFAQRYALHQEAKSLRISLAGREQTIKRQHEANITLLRELHDLRALRELRDLRELRATLEAAEANNSKMAQDNEALRLRAEAAEAQLKHEQANTETGARLCNEAFAALTMKVGTLEARLAETEKARDKVLRELENARTDREAQAKRIEVLSNLRDVLVNQRDEAINRRDAALRQSTAQLRRVEALDAELAEAKAAAQADHEQWVVALNDLRTEMARQRDDALRQRDALRVQTDRLGLELAEAQRRGDAALDDLAGVVRQRNERTEEREVLRQHLGSTLVELDTMTRLRDAALAQSRAQAKERDDALRQVQELRTAQQGTHRPPSVRVTVYLAEEDDGLPD